MAKPLDYYSKEQLKYKNQIADLQNKIKRSSLVRLGLFVSTAISAYLVFGNTNFFIAILIVGTILFTWLVISHQRLVYKKRLAEQLLKINTVEIEAINGDYSSLSTGREFIGPHHFLGARQVVLHP